MPLTVLNTYFSSTICAVLDIVCCDPSLIEALLDVLAKVIEVSISWAIVTVKALLEILSRCTSSC